MNTINAQVFDIDIDGLPPKDGLTGRLAFIHDGAIYSGWPLFELHLKYPENNHPIYSKYDWEGSETGAVVYSGVKKYIIFEKPIWKL